MASLICVFALALQLNAQVLTAQPTPITINTDRPAFADSSVVVPRDSLQMESGFLDTAAFSKQVFDFPETQFRFGVADKTELRFSAPDDYQGGVAGFSDILAGVKQQLGPWHGFDISLVVGLSFPTGAKQISSHGYDPQVQLPWSRKLSANWTAAGMLSVYWPTQGAKRNTTGQTTFLFDRQLTSPWDAFVEYVGQFPEMGGPQHILHFGTAYKLSPHHQIDIHGGVGLSAAAPDHFIGVGYSVLLNAR
jgi:hypothetical protein